MLKEIIAQEISRGGPITFARYMELCLYHPRYGYYMAPQPRRGKGGDYYTSPTVSPLFGQMVARQLFQMGRWIGGEFQVVEVGGGEGYLAEDILGYLREREPGFYRRLIYLSVEVNPFMVALQRDRLKGFEGKVSWPRWEELEGIRGCILSNELLDSLPVHRVKAERGLKEIYIGLKDGEFFELLGEPSEEVEEYFRWLGLLPPEGCEAEAGLSALRWLKEAAERLSEGFIVIIDYGHRAETLLSELYPRGTLLAYRGHRTHTDFYSEPGLDDLTAHVNFTAIIRKAEELGLRVLGLTTQGRFLQALGIFEGLEGEGKLRERLQAKRLILPGGMGDTFKVLILSKGTEAVELQGLR
ncbi:MAG: SAM-dependent methyltransferase [Deltaproteobacteria bacterium]|nr:MAG: SAM-dependent methyltransferase [Deltaproteobacteria bacterium]